MSNFDKYLDDEENFFKKTKEIKHTKKLLQKNDRSKFKKTDLDKKKTKILKNNLEKAKIFSIFGENILVKSNNIKFEALLRGNLKKDISKNSNILAVGDNVLISIENNKASIEEVLPRKSILSREDTKTKKQKIIAANIDQVLIIGSLYNPQFKPHLIDRYIIAAIKGNMDAIIIINKIDLLEKDLKEKEKYLDFLNIYTDLGYKIIPVSSKRKNNLSKIIEVMQNKVSVFSGQSGTGKSSILNKLFNLKLKTGKTSKLMKGTHVTTRSTLIELNENSYCIDTPGIKSFSIFDLTINDIKEYFFDIELYAKKCKFFNCNHIDEPECNVKKAVKNNKISCIRYESYINLVNEIKEKNE
ncbi:MAG: ribosome small subunit-dependent GTPase A [Chlamydiae bacterium RIFCSPHIGHO2_12_FULL_27_8]|nr:MAG: ribosome small subunit-dependent GTPase A [Chlamydiae bacterium RIFCSPHIGHO2_12_FULL_27_8]